MVSGLEGPTRRFVRAVLVVVAVLVGFTLLLLPVWPASTRSAVTSIGLLLAPVAAVIGAIPRVRLAVGREKRAWVLLGAAAATAVLGNLWAVAQGADPVTSPSRVGELAVALALAISTVGLLTFPGPRRRGAELVSMLLDGVVASTALLLVISVLAYDELFSSSLEARSLTGVLAVIIPLLDVALATVALLLILRAPRAQRVTFSLVAAGFLLYALADLTYAVRVSRGTFEFGTVLDLGWIIGYLLFGLAAWVPAADAREDRSATSGLTGVLGTVLVLSVLLVAAVVQFVYGRTAGPEGAQAVAWVVLVLAAGTRQVLLTVDNARLRRGLERRVAEQTQDLRRLARQNAQLLESVGDGIYGVDRDGRVTFLNPSASVALGWSLAEVSGQRAHDVFRAPDSHEGIPDWEQSPLALAMRDQVVQADDEAVYRRADGTTFPVELTAAPVLEDDEVQGAVVVFRDVTQRREVDRMKNEFLSVVSHELRTPLTSIRASLELIEGGHLGELPAGASALVSVALESGERLTRLINDLLDAERIESGAAPMQIEGLEARKLLESAVQQIAGLAGSLGIDVRIGTASGTVLGDRDQVLQVLLNLVGNACKFSETGHAVVLEAEPGDAWVTFRVRDQGRGIPADKLQSVFNRFGQVDSSDTRLHGGTGLGLAISRGIVHRHGGEIGADSVLGVGTTVSFTLPRARRSAEPELAPYAAGGGGREPGVDVVATVLVCDDDPVVTASFSAVLADHGFHPVGVTDGARVPELLRTESPDLLLLDLLMPGTTGAEVLAAVRADPTYARLPVVVVSALGPESDPTVAGSVEHWLVKPVGEQQLVETVHHTLGLARTPRPASVLLVEDDVAMGEVVTTRLSLAGLGVVRARTASEALQRAREAAPDLVVLDVGLPDGTGYDVVEALRRRPGVAEVPLVVYSTQEVTPEGRELLRLGETLFLEKSRTSSADLVRHVQELLVTTGHPPQDPPTHPPIHPPHHPHGPPRQTDEAHDSGGAARGATSTS